MRSQLCAVLRGEVKCLPDGDTRDRLRAAARDHRVDRLVAWKTGAIDTALRADAILDEVSVVELNRVLAALAARGVSPLVFKGAALAHTHYPESWLRPRVDTDLLIDSTQRDAAAETLQEIGYTQPPFLSGELVMFQTPFARVGTTGEEHHIDLHWRVANPHVLTSLPGYGELASRAQSVTVRGQAMRTPCPADALLLACVHRAAHHCLSDELLWIYDIHLLAEGLSATEWGDFVTCACTSQVRALCVDGLQSARDCFHTRIPDETFLDLVDARRPLERSSMYLRRDLTHFDRFSIDLTALTLRARARLAFEHLVPPAAYIRKKYGVRHTAFLPLFYLRRVVNGIGGWVVK